MLTDLPHVAFDVHDLDASLAFYAKLGLREAFRIHRDDGSLMLVYLHIGGDRFLELFPGGPEPGSGGRGSFSHVCLGTDDLEAEVARWRANGVPITSGPSVGYDNNLQAWTVDPDRNRIELMQITPHSPQAHVAHGEPVVPNDHVRPAPGA